MTETDFRLLVDKLDVSTDAITRVLDRIRSKRLRAPRKVDVIAALRCACGVMRIGSGTCPDCGSAVT